MATLAELVKEATDIVDIIGNAIDLKRSGRSYTAMCPFHDNTKTPAFVVFPETQTWRCFGACNEGGDVYSFWMRFYRRGFREALEELAGRAGIPLQSPDERRAAEKNRLCSLLQEAESFFHQILLSGADGPRARRYLRGRGLDGATVRAFKLGFAPPGWDNLKQHLMGLGYEEEELLTVGVLSQSEESGRTYDRFRERIIFPIRNKQGELVGFAGRSLDKKVMPKYLNTPDSIIFHKGHHLYGLDQVPGNESSLVVVEGYMDVVQGWKQGRRNLVAQMGTALTTQQVRLLRGRGKSFYLATDGDKAGQQATLKNAPQLLADGQKFDLEVHIISMPSGVDPDDVLRRNPDEWDVLVKEAKPVIEYAIDVVTQDIDLSDVRAKVNAADQVSPLIATLSNPIEQAHYRQMLADRLNVSEADIPEGTPIEATPDVAEEEKRKAVVVSSNRQARFLGQCIRYPGLLQEVDVQLRKLGEGPIRPGEFIHVEDRIIVDNLRHYNFSFDDAAERIEEIKSLPEVEKVERATLVHALTNSALAWRIEAVEIEITSLRNLIDSSPDTAGNYGEKLCGLHDQRRVLKQKVDNHNQAVMLASEAGGYVAVPK